MMRCDAGPVVQTTASERRAIWKWSKAFLLALLVSTLALPAWAQYATIIEEHYNRTRSVGHSPALVDGSFGERVDLMQGALSFYTTDVEIKQNSGLPMVLGRKFDTTKEYDGPGSISMNNTRVLGPYWDLDVPYMRGVFDLRTGWVGTGTTQFGTKNRCSQGGSVPGVPGQIQFSNRTYTPGDYWSGNYISLPGRGEELILGLPAGRASPNDGVMYTGTTKSEIRLGCLSTLKRGDGEGFVAALPDGTKYYFDWMWQRDYSSIQDSYCSSATYGNGIIVWGSPGSGCFVGTALPRVEVFIQATRMVDRFGNWVAYTYDSVNPQRLVSITSNEGASITLEYDSDGKINAARSVGRNWYYRYAGSGDSKNLSEVELPDGSKWKYAGSTRSSFVTASTLWDVCNVRVGTMSSASEPSAGEASTYAVTHPSGAIGEFKVRRLVHGSNQTYGWCRLEHYSSQPGSSAVPIFTENPKAYVAVSLYEKAISGPGIEFPQRWTYSYQPSWSWTQDCSSSKPCSDASYTRVTDPENVVTTYKFGNVFIGNYGLLLGSSVAKGGVEKESTSYQYIENASNQAFPASFGIGATPRMPPVVSRYRPISQITRVRDGVTYQTDVQSYDTFARPTKVARSSSK